MEYSMQTIVKGQFLCIDARIKTFWDQTLSMLARAHRISKVSTILHIICDSLKIDHFFENIPFSKNEIKDAELEWYGYGKRQKYLQK